MPEQAVFVSEKHDWLALPEAITTWPILPPTSMPRDRAADQRANAGGGKASTAPV